MKSADKGPVVVVWDRDDYIKEAKNQLGDRGIYEEVCNDPGPLISTIHEAIEKICKRSDFDADTIKCFMVKDPKSARFYLLQKIHKRLHDVPGRPVISNCGYYTENTSSFLDFHVQPLARKVKFYIKDTNDFFKKLALYQTYLMILFHVVLMLLAYIPTFHMARVCLICVSD